jgi:hypothetical protein
MVMILCGGASNITLSQIFFEKIPRCILKFNAASQQPHACYVVVCLSLHVTVVLATFHDDKYHMSIM